MRGVFAVALFVVLGAGAGCSRPNPGFGLAPGPGSTGALDEPGSSAPTTEPAAMTTSGESTSAGTLTTSGESTSTTTTTTSGGSSSTGGPAVVWPTMCDGDEVTTRAGVAIADTFLLSTFMSLDLCLEIPIVGECQDQGLGGVAAFQLFYEKAEGESQDQDYAGLFAARFGPLAPVYVDEDDNLFEVPPEAFLGVTVTVQLARTVANDKAWEAFDLHVYRMPTGDSPWLAGDNQGLELCGAGEASFRCRACLGEPLMPAECATAWATGMPFQHGVDKVLTWSAVEDVMDGDDLEFTLTSDWDWLVTDGLLLVPQALKNDRVEARASEFDSGAAGPFIGVRHCRPQVP